MFLAAHLAEQLKGHFEHLYSASEFVGLNPGFASHSSFLLTLTWEVAGDCSSIWVLENLGGRHECPPT